MGCEQSGQLEAYYRNPDLWDMARYESNANQRLRARMISSLVNGEVRSVLDVGCGNGFITRHFSADRVVGLDPSPEALDQVEGEKVLGRADRLPFADDEFDAIVCAEVLEHLPDEVYSAACREIRRVARGRIVIGVPYQQDLRPGMIECGQCHTRYHMDLHCRSFMGPADLAREFAGWRVTVTALIGHRRQIRSNLFRTLRYRLVGPTGKSDIARCPICSSAETTATREDKPFVRRVFDALAWRMPMRELANWMIVAMEPVTDGDGLGLEEDG